MSADVIDFNARSRRATLSGAAWNEARMVQRLVASDPDALALLASRVGDVGAAQLHDPATLERDLLRVAGAALAWLDRLGEDHAA